MSTHEDFPAELVDARAKDLYEAAFYGCVCDKFADSVRRHRYFAAARLSLRREVEACEPLVKALGAIQHESPHNFGEGSCACCVAADALRVHLARYAPTPKPETLADVAREAAEALRGNAELSERLLAAVEREKVQP